MPPYFLTVRLPYMLLAFPGSDIADDPDRILDPTLTHEKEACAFYEVDSQIVAKGLLDLFRYGKPTPGIPGDPSKPVGSLEGVRKLIEGACEPVFELVDAAELDLAQRVFCHQHLEVLEGMASCDGDPGVREDAGLPNDRRTVLLWEHYERARQWEPLLRDELGIGGGQPGEPGKASGSPSPADEARAAAHYLSRLLSFAKAVDKELQRSAVPSYPLDTQIVRSNCGVVLRLIGPIVGRAMIDIDAMAGYGVAPITLMSWIGASGHESDLCAASRWLADLCPRLVEALPRPGNQLVEDWHQAVTLLKKAVGDAIGRDLPRLEEMAVLTGSGGDVWVWERRTVGPHVHLRDIVTVLFPGDQNSWQDKKALERRTAAFNLTLTILRDNWESPFDPERLKEYAAPEAVSAEIKRIRGLDPEPVGGKHAEIDVQIRRLHDAGITVEVLEAVRKEYPDVAKATGLDRAEVIAGQEAKKPGALAGSAIQGAKQESVARTLLDAIFHPEPDWDTFLSAIKRKPAAPEIVLEAICVWEDFPNHAGRILTDDIRKAIKTGTIAQDCTFAPKIAALQKLMRAHQETTLFLAAQMEKAGLDSSKLSGCAEAGLLAILNDPSLAFGLSSIFPPKGTSEETARLMRDANAALFRLKAKVKMDAATPASQPAHAGQSPSSGELTDAMPKADTEGQPSGGEKPVLAPVDEDAMLSPARLAERFGIPEKKQALKKRLERLRKTNHNCFTEVADRGPKDPLFLYRVRDVRPIIESLKASRERPA